MKIQPYLFLKNYNAYINEYMLCMLISIKASRVQTLIWIEKILKCYKCFYELSKYCQRSDIHNSIKTSSAILSD